MWFADVVVDLQWFIASKGKLGQPRARTTQTVNDPNLETEILLYGDDEAIRHLRVMIHTDDDSTAHACVNRNVQQWVNALEVSSTLTTPSFATAARLQRNSASFMVFLGNGDENGESIQLDLKYKEVTKADLANAARLITAWKPDFKIHLHYLSRFLNYNLLPEVRWLNGYRLLEWHFLRGKVGLADDPAYRLFLEKHGADFDAYRRPNQTRRGVIEEVRALVAHAILSETSEASTSDGTKDLVLRTFAALEKLVMELLNEAAEGVIFGPKPR